MLKWIWKKPEKSETDRDAERYDVAVRVKSRQLPGFRALTLDVSGSGLQLETQELLREGQVLELELDFDREELPDFSCPAEVMWAKGDDTSRNYLAGLAFRPKDDSAKLHLARMGAVLETRSEADIQDLLADANKLDPEREAFFAQKGQDTATIPQGGQARVQPHREKHPGVLIPMDIRIDGYRWERNESGGRLVLNYTEGQDSHELIFPNCQLCHDYGCGFHRQVVGMFATIQSERLRELRSQRVNHEPWKHYRFIAPNRDPVLDIISLSCQTEH
jgi:PilZ domain-containing protein